MLQHWFTIYFSLNLSKSKLIHAFMALHRSNFGRHIFTSSKLNDNMIVEDIFGSFIIFVFIFSLFSLGSMVGEAEIRRSIRLIFGVWNVRTGVIVEQDRISSVDQFRLLLTQFSVHIVDFLTIGLCCGGLTGCRKLKWINPAADHHTVIMVFVCGFSPLGSAWVTHWYPTTVLKVSCWRRGSTFHHTWRDPIQKRNVLVAQKQIVTFRAMISKRDNFGRSFKWWGTHFSRFLTFPMCFKPSKTAFSNPRPELLYVDHFEAHFEVKISQNFANSVSVNFSGCFGPIWIRREKLAEIA